MAGSNGVHQAAAAGGGRGGAAAALYAAGRSQPPGAALSPLSETLWRAKSGTMTSSVAGAAGDQQKLQPHRDFSARLTWVDLWVTVTGRGPKHAILQGLTGYAEPGSIMAIMGPSGSGKSTLLDTLAGRLAKTASQTGEVLLNGHRKTNLSYGIAVWTLSVSLSLCLSLENTSALVFCPEIGLSLISLSLREHICFTSGLVFCTEIGLSLSENPSSHHFSNFAQKLGSISQRTHLLYIFYGNFAQNTDYKYTSISQLELSYSK
jgi:hypothetical protein